MQSNIFELIDLLVKMSGSTANLDELKAELDDTESKIFKLQQKLQNLEEDMNDEKYFDASSEIVDRNIKISLVQKLHKLEKVRNDIEKELESAEAAEVACARELEEVNEKINAANEINMVINENASETEAYKNMIAAENNRFSKLLSKRDELSEESSALQRKTEYYGLQLQEVNDKIAKETDRLDEVNNTLSNVRAYIDVEAKEKDEKKYTDIKKQLEELVSHKDEILNDAVYIAGTIKELIANEDKDNVETEFNRLVDTVKKIPYMDLETDEISGEKDKLDEELKKYDEEISHKQYQTMDGEFIEERITYLTENIASLNKKIDELNTQIDEITKVNENLSEKICRSEKQIELVEESLIDYEMFDYESQKLPKSVVQASNNKLVEEKNNISEIVDNYRADLVKNIEEVKAINAKLDELKAEVETKTKELDNLNKKLALNTKSKNILEEEKDKIKLQDINEKITDLKKREEFDKSISSILDEFEMLFSSLEFVDKETRNKRVKEPEMNFNVEVSKDEDKPVEKEKELSFEEISESIKAIDFGKVEEVKAPEKEEAKDETTSESKDDKSESDVLPLLTPIEDESIFPAISDEKKEDQPKDEKLRVVEILPITDNLKEKDDQDFMVSDFKDDDYVDINTAMTSVEEG